MKPLAPEALAQALALLDGMPVGTYVFRLERPPDESSLRIIFANRASAGVLGLDPAIVVGSLIGEYFPNSGESTGIAAAYRDVVVTQTGRDFGVVSYADEAIGESRFALSAYPLGSDLVVILFDNLSAPTERRQELAAIVDSATDAIISNDIDGRILSWNRSAESIYGYSAAEAIGQPISMLLPRDRADEMRDLLQRLGAGERVEPFETTRVRKDGTVIDISLTISPLTDRQGAIVGAAAIARDIGAQKDTAVELQRLAAIVAASEDAITSRTPDGIILSWNAAAERLLGYTAAEMVGRPVGVLDPAEIAEDVRAIRERMERGERQAYPYETAIRRKDGSEVHISVSSSPIIDEEGRVVGIASVMRDVSDQRRLEEQLRQSQKMEAIGSLAGGVAHDFNNVLTVIRTASEGILAEVDNGAIRDRVHHIDLAAAHAAALTRQLLAFSRHQVLTPEAIDLSAIVSETCGMAGRLIGSHIQVGLDLGDDLAPVEMDRSQLQQVILNLFVNARDAMPDGGHLNVRTANVVLDEPYVTQHLDVAPGEYGLLEITDSGHGMDAQTTSRIFDPFFTTKSEGTGLGLATVYGIVKQSGGQIFVYSEPGIGTTFKVYLPRARATEWGTQPAPAAAQPRHGGSETILLVEDAELLRPMIVEILASQGYTVLAAADGFEALALFDAHDGPIDLLLTDVVMPRMSGRELAEQIVARDASVQVMFTSGYPHDEAVHRLVEGRQIAFIQKPYARNELLARIRDVLAVVS